MEAKSPQANVHIVKNRMEIILNVNGVWGDLRQLNRIH